MRSPRFGAIRPGPGGRDRCQPAAIARFEPAGRARRGGHHHGPAARPHRPALYHPQGTLHRRAGSDPGAQWARSWPVFWVAGDDHDFSEASSASWIAATARCALRCVAPPPEAPLTPMYRLPLGEEIDAVLTQLAMTPAGLPHGPRRAPPILPATPNGGQRCGGLAELLAPSGIVCLESTHPAVKRAEARHLIRALGLARSWIGWKTARRSCTRRAWIPVCRWETVQPGNAEGSQGRDRLVQAGRVRRRGGRRSSLESLQRDSRVKSRTASLPMCCCGR